MSEEPDRLVGQVLADTYRLEALLVSGGMGSVYVGRHLRTGGPCAVKVLSQKSASNAEIYERFQDEARISCTLRHPHIVQVMDLDQGADGTPFLVMELLEGEDLHDRLERQGRLPLPDVLRLARQVGSALSAAHELDIVHRDLKPQNIFLARTVLDGTSIEVAKVLDFGLSKLRRPSARVTRDSLVLGTPKYLSPEAALGYNSQIDGRSDQFSLGVILYRALSGRAPFESEDVAEVLRQVAYAEPAPLARLAPELPGAVCAAIARAMQKDKGERFPTMGEFVAALCGGEVSLGPPPAPPSAPPPRRSTPESQALTGIIDQDHRRAEGATVIAGRRAEAATMIAAFVPGPPSLIERALRWRRLFVAFAGGAAACGLLLWAASTRLHPHSSPPPPLPHVQVPAPPPPDPPPAHAPRPSEPPPAARALLDLPLPAGQPGRPNLGIPPMRPAGEALATMPLTPIDVAAVLQAAQAAYAGGDDRRAIALAHAAVGHGPTDVRAYGVLGLAGCRRRDLALACAAREALEPRAQDLLDEACALTRDLP